MTCKCRQQNVRDYEYRPCDVCYLVRRDGTWKWVRYCRFCNAYICDDCWRRYDLRAVAAIKRQLAALRI